MRRRDRIRKRVGWEPKPPHPYFPRYGRWYYKGCKAVGGGGEPERKKLYDAEKRLLAAKRNLVSVEMNFPPEAPEMRAARDFYEREKKRWEKVRRQVLQPSFTEATYFLGMDIYPREAVRFSSIASVSFFIALLLTFYALVSLFPAHYDFYRSYLLPVVLFGPVAVFLFMSSRTTPRDRISRVKSEMRFPRFESNFSTEDCKLPTAVWRLVSAVPTSPTTTSLSHEACWP